MWDVEPDSGRTPAPAEIAAMVREQVRPGSIVLLHPWYASGGDTRASIRATIAGLRADGYRFVTVAELLALQGQPASTVAIAGPKAAPSR